MEILKDAFERSRVPGFCNWICEEFYKIDMVGVLACLIDVCFILFVLFAIIFVFICIGYLFDIL